MVDVKESGGNEDVQRVALPLHIQRLQQLLDVTPLLNHVEKLFDEENGGDWGQRYITTLDAHT